MDGDRKLFRVVGVVVAAAALLPLGACDMSPEVDACENYIREKIATPASLKIVSSSSVPSTGTRIAGLTAADEVQLVSIEYDAANQYGAPIRSTEYCIFRRSAGKLPPSSEMKGQAKRAADETKMKALRPIYSSLDESDIIARADALEAGKTIYGCCMEPPVAKASTGGADEE